MENVKSVFIRISQEEKALICTALPPTVCESNIGSYYASYYTHYLSLGDEIILRFGNVILTYRPCNIT